MIQSKKRDMGAISTNNKINAIKTEEFIYISILRKC